MKCTCLGILLFLGISFSLSGQPFEPVYTVDVTVNPDVRTVEGHCTIRFSAGISTIRLRCDMNAFRSKNSAFAKKLLEKNNRSFYFYDEIDLGGYTSLNITANGQKTKVDPTLEIIEIEMPSNGGQENELKIEYALKLPAKTAGIGFFNSTLYLKHWYPTLAHFDGKKWYAGEFNPDKSTDEAMGKHTVTIHHPAGYIALHESKHLNELQLPAYHLTTTGKSPYIIIAPERQVYSFFTKSDKDNILTGVLNRPPTEQELRVFETQGTIAIDMWTELFPFSPRHRFYYFYQNKPEKFGRFFIFHHSLWDLLQQHYLYPHQGEPFMKTLSNYYMHYFTEMHCSQSRLSDEKLQRLNMYYLPEHALRHFDKIPDKSYFFDTDDQEYFTECCGRYVGWTLFLQLENYLGKAAFRAGLTEYLKQHFQKEISFDGMIHFFSAREGKDLVPFLVNHQSPGSRSDYAITDVTADSAFTTITITNHGKSNPPLMVRNEYKKDSHDVWFEGFSGTKNFAFPTRITNDSAFELTLDPERLLREKSSENHVVRVKTHNQITKTTIKNQPYAPQKTSLFPAMGYNYSDKYFLGLRIQNQYKNKFKGVFYSAMPMYSFSAKRLIGEGKIGYNFIPAKSTKLISPYLHLKSFDKFFQKEKKYRERYVKLQPGVDVYFNNRKKKVNSALQLRSVLLWEEEGQFSMTGDYTGNTYRPSVIWTADYFYHKPSALGDFNFSAGFEQQTYKPVFSANDASYGKMTAIMTKTFYYNRLKKIDVRLFGAAFLWNSNKNSLSFDPAFTRGSIALSHQSFNDYLYDDYYLVRDNQNISFGRQVSYASGGGFKHALGSAYNIGMSNQYAAAVNITSDLPIPPLKMLKVFFDAGLYGKADNTTGFLYSGGFSLHYKKYAKLHYPLVMSPELKTIHGGKTFTFGLLSFSVDLMKIQDDIFNN
jgi:hypothetical protein